MANSKKQKLIVVGNGMAAMRTVEHILDYQQNAKFTFDITVIGAEPHGNYNRIMLSPVLAGEKSFKDIMLHTKEWYAENNIELRAGVLVEDIDRKNKNVILEGGESLAYDQVLLATGSNPFIIPVQGKELPGVISYRTIEDVEAMKKAANSHKHAVVIGGGVLGLEAAFGLMKQGMKVSVVHNESEIMNRQLDKRASLMLQKHLEGMGMNFLLNKSTASCEGTSRVARVTFTAGPSVCADLVVMAVGVRANLTLADKIGLSCERGILVDDYLLTEDESIHAVGECIQHQGMTYGLVAPLFEQAVVCSKHMLNLDTEGYEGSQLYTSLKVTGVNLYSAGDFVGDDTTEDLVYEDLSQGVYKKLVIKDNKVIGVNLYGDISDAVWYRELFQDKTDISDMREDLIFGQAFMPDQTDTEAA